MYFRVVLLLTMSLMLTGQETWAAECDESDTRREIDNLQRVTRSLSKIFPGDIRNMLKKFNTLFQAARIGTDIATAVGEATLEVDRIIRDSQIDLHKKCDENFKTDPGGHSDCYIEISRLDRQYQSRTTAITFDWTNSKSVIRRSMTKFVGCSREIRAAKKELNLLDNLGAKIDSLVEDQQFEARLESSVLLDKAKPTAERIDEALDNSNQNYSQSVEGTMTDARANAAAAAALAAATISSGIMAASQENARREAEQQAQDWLDKYDAYQSSTGTVNQPRTSVRSSQTLQSSSSVNNQQFYGSAVRRDCRIVNCAK